MRLDTAFGRVALAVDAERLAAEVAAIPASAWRPHPEGMVGNSSLSLLSVGGDPGDDGVRGPMRPTPHLAACPYASRVLRALGAPIGRTRFMRIDAGGEASPHCDTNYYWQERLRVHVPVVTTPGVLFHCGGDVVHMAPGEVWVFDTWRQHKVVNPAPDARIHLVADTVGSAPLWDLIERPGEPALVEPGPAVELVTESVNHPGVMTPWEQEALAGHVLGLAGGSDPGLVAALTRDLSRLHRQWRAGWACFGDDPAGRPSFSRWRDDFDRSLRRFDGRIKLANGLDAVEALRQLVVRPAIGPSPAMGRVPPTATAVAGNGNAPAVQRRPPERLDQPVFIVSPPRSGSSLLFETLALSPDLFTIGGESHAVIESIPELHPAGKDWASNRLDATDATPATIGTLAAGFVAQARDRDGHPPAEGSVFRLLEKTPKNALRVPFLAAAFPDATFVYLYRDPRETISSMLDAWRSGRFVTYPQLPGWPGPPWSLLLSPGWRELVGRSLVEVVAAQWAATTTQLLDDLEALDPGQWATASFDRLVADPQAEISRLCGFVGAGWDRNLPDQLPPSRHTLSSPEPEKWRHNAEELKAVIPSVTAVAERARSVFARAPATIPAHRRSRADAPRPPQTAPTDVTTPAGNGDAESPFRSVHTASFAPLLQRLGATLAVTTYQSGRLILVRADGDRLNTHLRFFKSPMGLARHNGRLALATAHGIWEYHEQPALAERVDPSGRTDTCFVPRRHFVTGDIRTHEVVYAGDELWAVNTRFSCLATFDGSHSFVPRWRPAFVTALAADDRCHLNGVAVADGRPTFVTAHGHTDTANGWRDTKESGGVIIDVASGEIAVSGLSMPHSPRVAGGRLWLCDSGNGRVVVADPARGTFETVAELPGFTRGLAVAGGVVFVGLSQVREHVFSGIPLGERVSDRVCGVWALDAATGATLGFVRFEGAVQEIFDVQVLAGTRYPELVEPDADLVGVAIHLPPGALSELAAT